MATYKQMVAGLSDDFKARDIARLVYFHCDHFEPWQSFGGRDALDEHHAEHIRIFTDELKRIDYARKLTLFYKANINFAYDRDRELIRAADDDLVGFLPRSDSEVAAARTNMKYLAANSAHELQIHIHHEGYTYNTSHTAPDVRRVLQITARARARWAAAGVGNQAFQGSRPPGNRCGVRLLVFRARALGAQCGG